MSECQANVCPFIVAGRHKPNKYTDIKKNIYINYFTHVFRGCGNLLARCCRQVSEAWSEVTAWNPDVALSWRNVVISQPDGWSVVNVSLTAHRCRISHTHITKQNKKKRKTQPVWLPSASRPRRRDTACSYPQRRRPSCLNGLLSV